MGERERERMGKREREGEGERKREREGEVGLSSIEADNNLLLL